MLAAPLQAAYAERGGESELRFWRSLPKRIRQQILSILDTFPPNVRAQILALASSDEHAGERTSLKTAHESTDR